MLSRERIAEVSGGADATHTEIGDLCYLALLAIDGKRDRKLGEAVRRALVDYGPNGVFDAIAAALREEGAK